MALKALSNHQSRIASVFKAREVHCRHNSLTQETFLSTKHALKPQNAASARRAAV